MTPPAVLLPALFGAAVRAADPAAAVQRHLRRQSGRLIVGPYEFDPARGRVFLVAAGKAAIPMGKAALEILQDWATGAILVTKRGPGPQASLPASSHADWDVAAWHAGAPNSSYLYHTTSSAGRPVRIYETAHPIPDHSSVQAATAVRDLLQQTTSQDLLLCLISGGASALLSQPLLDLAYWQILIESLLASGCTIQELNTVRKQLDEVKGGGLAAWAAPAACVSLILSDVVGNPLDIIASGPTVPNEESPADAYAVLHRYDLPHSLPRPVWEAVQQALDMDAARRPELDDLQIANLIIGDIGLAAEAARQAAQEAGYATQLLTTHLHGEAREAGRFAAALALDMPAGHCYLLGGETTVTMRGSGRGGRNQELALAAALEIAGRDDLTIATFATDGEDGPTNAAGALVDGRTIPAAEALGLDPRAYLHNNDSHTFFSELARRGGPACLLVPGRTGTNVNDLLVILRGADVPAGDGVELEGGPS